MWGVSERCLHLGKTNIYRGKTRYIREYRARKLRHQYPSRISSTPDGRQLDKWDTK